MVKPVKELLFAPVMVKVNVSLPKPPSMESPELIVVWAAPVVATVAGAVIVSSPAEPTIASTLVVSDQTAYDDMYLILNNFL